MPHKKRRATDLDRTLGRRHKVSHEVLDNRKLDSDMRMENLEHDIVFNTQVLYDVLDKQQTAIDQNNRYTVYLEAKIQREQESTEFWKDVRKRAAASTIFGLVAIILGALWYAFTEFVKAPA